MKILVIPVIILLLFLNISYAQIELFKGSVSGTITDMMSDFPIQGANVSIETQGKNAVSDANGLFRIEGLKSGTYNISVNHAGYKSGRKEVTIVQDILLEVKIKLSPSEIETGEITVSSVRYETMLKDIALPLEVVSDDDILRRPVNNIAEALDNKPGISLTRDGIWSADVSIRGISKTGVVILVDGNRVETATDLSARLSMIEVSDIDRIEVIKGGVSSLYGTGAIGGVINIFTKGGDFSNKTLLTGSLVSGYNTVNKNASGWLSMNASSQRWYAKLTGSMRSASNTMTPNGELPNSQFKDNNISAYLGFKPVTNHELRLTYQNYSAKDVGIPGGYPLFPNNALVTYPQEKRELISAEYRIKDITKSFKNFSVKYYYQHILRDVENIPFTVQIKPAGNGQPKQKISVLKITPVGNHYTNGILAQTDWILGKYNYLIIGVEAWQRSLDSKREKEQKIESFDSAGTIVVSTLFKTSGEKPIPDAEYRSIGAFAQDEMKLLNNRLKITIGGRADQIRVTNSVTFQPYYEIVNGVINYSPAGQKKIWDAKEADDISWSANLGAIYSLSKSIDVTLNVSRSFRSPSLEERYQYIDLGSLLRVGNPYLQPEKGAFLDAGVRVWKSSLTFTGNIFYNTFIDLVAEVPGIYEGRQAAIKTNIGKARLYGYDFGVMYNFYKSFTAYGTMAYVRGEDTENSLNLPQMPPLNARLGIKFSVLNYVNADLNTVLFDKQNNTAPLEFDTPGYVTFNAEFGSSRFKTGPVFFQVFAGIENILDKEYRNHLATNRGGIVVEPGRNFYAKLKLDF